jgi:soluble lytic murein transglycosylase
MQSVFKKIGTLSIGAVAVTVVAVLLANAYWTSRFDSVIRLQAPIYKLDDRLVWSIIYQETYFRPWMIGADAEVGLMQVTPTVVRMWAKETGLKDFERRAAENPQELVLDPERNIQVGCWYLEKVRLKYRGAEAEAALALAAYNAGPSRVDEWTRDADVMKITEEEFLGRIDIDSTRAYVRAILARYKAAKK